MSKSNTIYYCGMALFVGIFLLSLNFDVVYHGNKIPYWSPVIYLLVGWMGVIVLQFGWLANMLVLGSIIYRNTSLGLSNILAWLAFILSLQYYFMPVLIMDGGGSYNVTGWGLGYIFWVSSFFVFAVCNSISIFYLKRELHSGLTR